MLKKIKIQLCVHFSLLHYDCCKIRNFICICGMYCLHWKLKLFDVLFTDPCHQDEGGVHHHQDDGEEVIVEAG